MKMFPIRYVIKFSEKSLLYTQVGLSQNYVMLENLANIKTTNGSKALDQLLPRPDRARISGPKGPEILVLFIPIHSRAMSLPS